MIRTTSLAAAESIAPKSATLRAQVLSFIKARGAHGATDEECQLALQMNPSTQRPRRIELQKSHDVVDSGATRNTTSKRKAVVWIAAEFAKREVRQMEFAL